MVLLGGSSPRPPFSRFARRAVIGKVPSLLYVARASLARMEHRRSRWVSPQPPLPPGWLRSGLRMHTIWHGSLRRPCSSVRSLGWKSDAPRGYPIRRDPCTGASPPRKARFNLLRTARFASSINYNASERSETKGVRGVTPQESSI
jgi:hypothetical protein